jgi:hypothetical protein
VVAGAQRLESECIVDAEKAQLHAPEVAVGRGRIFEPAAPHLLVF